MPEQSKGSRARCARSGTNAEGVNSENLTKVFHGAKNFFKVV